MYKKLLLFYFQNRKISILIWNRKKLLLIILLLLYNGTIYAQYLNSNNTVLNMPYYGLSYNNDGEVIPHTQKTKICNVIRNNNIYNVLQFRSITLSNYKLSNGKIRSVFFLNAEPIEEDGIFGDGTIFTVFKLPDSIQVEDIEILDTVLYFCGQILSPATITTTEEHTRGFIAYIPLNCLFLNEQANNINYINPGCYIVNKLRVFKDNLNNVNIFAMGTEKRVYPPEAVISNNYDINDPPRITWIIRNPTFHDCALLYNVNNNKQEFMTMDRDNNSEKLQDINISKGNLEMVSLKYNETATENIENEDSNCLYTSDSTKISNKLICRRFQPTNGNYFDNNLQQYTSYFDIRFFNNSNYYDDANLKGIYNVRLDSLTGIGNDLDYMNAPNNEDLFTLSFNYYETNNNYYATIINAISWEMYSQQVIRCKSSHRIWEGTSPRKIWDLATVCNIINSKYCCDSKILLENIESNNLSDMFISSQFDIRIDNVFNLFYYMPSYSEEVLYNFYKPHYSDNPLSIFKLNSINNFYTDITRRDERNYEASRIAGTIINRLNNGKKELLFYQPFNNSDMQCIDKNNRTLYSKHYPIYMPYPNNENNLTINQTVKEIYSFSLPIGIKINSIGEVSSENYYSIN